MNILVIGNGFDLAYKLPTRYIDFINFLDYFYKQYVKELSYGFTYRDGMNNLEEERKCAYNKLLKVVRDKIEENKIEDYIKVEDSIWEKFRDRIKENYWVLYFVKKLDEISLYNGWIDCEKEISEIIQAIEYEIQLYKKGKGADSHGEKAEKDELVNTFFDKFNKTPDYINNYRVSKNFDKFEERLTKDLDNFIECLEIYFREIVAKIPITNTVKEIDDITRGLNGYEGKEVDHILNFNYTNTFSKVYPGHEANKNCNYIHGKVRDRTDKRRNNMVLGIDEYLNDEERNENLNFIYFKKYFQRLYKLNSFDYKDWIYDIKTERINREKELFKNDKEIQNANADINSCVSGICIEGYRKKEYLEKEKKRLISELAKDNSSNIYFFGHSLDVTDRDILRMLILGYDKECDKETAKDYKVNIKIYYFNDKAYKDQLAHLVKVIGQDELIKRTTGPNRNIEFIRQQEQ